jgi:hypothetical protein
MERVEPDLPRWLQRGLWVFSALALLATFARMFAGADFMDEAFYAVLAWRFVLGDTPFVDEINPVQTAALITRPFVEVYTRIVGDTTGLLLALRMLWFGGNLVLVALGWRVLRRHAPSALAGLCALFPLLLVPIGLPAPSYNTCASGFFAAGLYIALLALRPGNQPRWLLAAGACHALACVALPTYALAILLFALLTLRARAHWCLWLAGGLIAVLPLANDLLRIGPATLGYVSNYWERERSWSEHTLEVLRQSVQLVPSPAWLCAALLLLLFALRFARGRSGAPIAIASVVLLVCCYADRRWASSVSFASLVALIGVLMVRFLRPPAELTRSLFWPSLLGLLVAAFTSGNGLINGAFGGWPAAMLSILWLGLAARDYWSVLAPLCGSLLLLFAQRQPYNEDLITRFDERFTDGPYKGLWTSKDKRGYLDGIRGDVRAVVDETKPILFAHQFPAGYLFTRCRPATHTSFGLLRVPGELPPAHAARMREDIAFRVETGMLVVRMRMFQVQWDRRYEWPDTGGDEWIQAQQRLVKRPAWSIYRVER